MGFNLRLSGRGSRQKSCYTADVLLLGAICAYSAIFFLSTWLVPFCSLKTQSEPSEWNNPMYYFQACRSVRHVVLLGLTLDECEFGRRIIAALLLGGLIGYERRLLDKPAGVRTMSLACIGSCAFTICSGYGFGKSPVLWDSSRIAAAIPSGVGFLGAGVIWRGRQKGGSGEVRGLTTAASVWLSSAVGVALGGQLYGTALYTTIWTVIILRYGPQLGGLNDSSLQNTEKNRKTRPVTFRQKTPYFLRTKLGIKQKSTIQTTENTEKDSLLQSSSSMSSTSIKNSNNYRSII